MCIFGRQSLRGPSDHPPHSWCSHTCVVHLILYQHRALRPPAYGEKGAEATLTLGDKRQWLPFCPCVLLYFLFICKFLLGHLLYWKLAVTLQVALSGRPRGKGTEASGHQPERSWGLKACVQPLLNPEMNWLTVWLQLYLETLTQSHPARLCPGSWLSKTVRQQMFTVV